MSNAQKAMAEFLSPCTHPRRQKIISSGGQTMGEQCSRCLALLWAWGKCDGCGREKKLARLISTKGKRYCTEDCRLASLKAKREKEKEP
jgi:hypothetical protein